MSTLLTDDQIKAAAIANNIEPAALRAVAVVESGKLGGFLPDGQPVILFEGHVFWRELVKRNLDPERFKAGNEDILYPSFKGRPPYGPSSAQHGRLQRAAAINRDAALSSASWGRFQVMGFNWAICGFQSLQQFINAMYRDEAAHLSAAVEFIKSNRLMDALQARDWPAFARGYNGTEYAANKYDIRLAEEYARAKREGW